MSIKNSFYEIATALAQKNTKTSAAQLLMIDNFTTNSPILSGMPFQKASHPYHHMYSRLLNADNLKKIDFDSSLPTLRTESQLEMVKLTAFGGNFKFGEDLMKQTVGTPDAYIASQVPAVLRASGMAFEQSIYFDNFLPYTDKNGRAMSVQDSVTNVPCHTIVAVTWEPGEMTGLFSPLPYGSGTNFGQLFETDWANNMARHDIGNGVYGYAASIKIFIGMLLANKRKIASLVNIVDIDQLTAKQLGSLVNSASATSSTRLYCSAALKTAIAAKFSQQQQGNGLVAVTSTGEVTVMGVPIVASNNIEPSGFMSGVPVV